MPQPQYTPVSGPGTLSPDKQWKFTSGGWVANTVSKPTPTSFKDEAPATILPPAPPMPDAGTQVSDLGNLRSALRAALSEAAQQTATNRIQQLSGLLEGGAAPSVMNAALGLAQSGLKTSQETVFGDYMAGYTEEQKAKEAKKTSAFNMINTMIDNGVFVDTPAGTLLAMEKESGLSEGTALAWQARLKIEQDKSEEKGNLELQLLRKEIEDKGKPDQPSNFIDIMQEVIDKDGTPEQAAREAAQVSEGQEIQVDQKTINAWTEQARKLKKNPPPPPPPAPYEPKKKGFFEFFKKPVSSEVKAGKQPTVPANRIFEDYKGISPTDVNSFFSNLFGQ